MEYVGNFHEIYKNKSQLTLRMTYNLAGFEPLTFQITNFQQIK
jgi:hypothetical protein